MIDNSKFIGDALQNQRRANDQMSQISGLETSNYKNVASTLMVLATIAGGIAFGATTLCSSYFNLKQVGAEPPVNNGPSPAERAMRGHNNNNHNHYRGGKK